MSSQTLWRCFLFVFAILILCSSAYAQGGSSLREDVAAAKEVSVEDGDVCIVCGKQINQENGLVLMVRGRRVPLAKKMRKHFESDPENFFSKLQARGALFTESFERVEPHYGWLIFGIVVVVLVSFGGMTAGAAIRRGLDPGKWFFSGLFGNVFSLAQISRQGAELENLPTGLGKVRITPEPVACPQCGSENHPSASKCSVCGEALSPVYQSEKDRVG